MAFELDSAYVSNVSKAEQSVLSWEHFTRVKRIADLAPVGDESARGCVGITLRGLKSLQCPSWRDLKHQNQAAKRSGCNWCMVHAKMIFMSHPFSLAHQNYKIIKSELFLCPGHWWIMSSWQLQIVDPMKLQRAV